MTEFRPGGFSIIPPVIKNLLIINGLIFFAQLIFDKQGNPFFDKYLALHDVHSVFFRPYQIVTYMFLHGGWDHIIFNMFALWMFGSILENVWGSKRFLIFYMLCGIGAALLQLLILYYEMGHIMDLINVETDPEQIRNYYLEINGGTVGASGAIFGCLAAFGYLFPNDLIYMYFFVPIKAKWFVLIYGGIELYLGVKNSAGDTVAHWAHIGGAVVGLIIVIIWNKTNRKTFY